MKSLRHFILAVAALVCGPVFSAVAQDANGHVLTDLWKQYEAAANADLPKQEAEILEKIKTEAAGKRLPVDFYDAATSYVNARARRNWKERSDLEKALEAEIAAFNEPIVTFIWMADYQYAGTTRLSDYVLAHPDGFNGRNSAFYSRRLGSYLGGALPHFIESDREYVLWRMLNNRSWGPLFEELKTLVQGRYPAECCFGYATLPTGNERAAALDSLIARYDGKAAALYPKAERLQSEYYRLEEKNAGSAEFKALYNRCQEFEKQRNAYKGDEALIAKGCETIKGLCKTLTSENLWVSVNDGRVIIRFRNCASTSLVMRPLDNGPALHRWNIKNPTGSFYAIDTASIAVPTVKDGDYRFIVDNGTSADETTYLQHTLSLALRYDARGWCAYVTDHKSGMPLTGTLTFHVSKNSKEIETLEYTAEADFTPLPKSVQKQLDKNGFLKVRVTTGSRNSDELGINTRYYGKASKITPSDSQFARIYRDRGAYHPGDTLRFKSVLYKGNPDTGYKVMNSKKVEVNLMDTEYNIVETQKLKTGAFGSVSGEFVIPTGLRGGEFSLAICEPGKDDDLAMIWFPVDEFVEPTYTLSFDKLDKLFLTGEIIPVSGRLESYSGHPMSGATIHLTVSRWNSLVAETELAPDPATGQFSFEFKATGTGYHKITARVTDATGETLSFTSGVYVDTGVRIDATVLGAAQGSFELKSDNNSRYYRYRGYSSERDLLLSDTLSVRLEAQNSAGTAIPDYPTHYALFELGQKDTVMVTSGTVKTGELLNLPLKKESTLYLLKCNAQSVNGYGHRETAESETIVLHLGKGRLPARLRSVFVEPKVEGDKIRLRLGAGDGPQWTVLAIYDKEENLLHSELIRTKDYEDRDLAIAYQTEWPDAIRVELFAFKDSAARIYGSSIGRPRITGAMPLELLRKQTSGQPGMEYQFTLKTDPGSEVLVAVWDKSLEAIEANPWSAIALTRSVADSPSTLTRPGLITGGGASGSAIMDEDEIVAYGVMREKAGAVVNEAVEVRAEMAEEEESSDAQPAAADKASGDTPRVRTDFATALTFQPQLMPDKDGKVQFSFRTADKLSTYIIGVFAHDKTMCNATLKSEFLVTIPVRVSITEPRYLYSGDRYEVAVTVSSIAPVPVSGTLKLETSFLAGMTKSTAQTQLFTEAVTLDPNATVVVRFPVEGLNVTPAFVGDQGSLTLKASFVAPAFSDALQLSLPVYPAAQTLTEAHSAVLRAGMDRAALLTELQSRFVNVPGLAATLKEVSILDMVKEAIPTKVEPAASDVLSLSEAWYVRLLAAKLLGQDADTEELMEKILACQNADGGFGWFDGMDSSPVMTAVILERVAKIRAQGFTELPDLDSAVRYLDQEQFSGSSWYGITDAQYMYVRSLYAAVPFAYKPSGKAAEKRFAEYKKNAANYLLPSKKRGLTGEIILKARRLLTLRALAASKEGLALAKAWGVSGNASKLTASMKADLLSLSEYAVEYKDGGWYFPNAVMPWRGLLEGEAYAHALLCDLFSQAGDSAQVKGNEIADGVRLWLMLQKETQQWDSDPAFVDAISSILAGSPELLDTRVIALSATYTAPFEKIAAAGNGFTIERELLRLSGTQWQPIAPGDSVAVGDRIRAEYRIHSDENRSFVRVIAGREATLRPVEQLSGFVYGFGRSGYREVKADRTTFWFDRYPEENTVLREEFFVQQAGSFVAPVVTVESLYAPHYRANSGYRKFCNFVCP